MNRMKKVKIISIVCLAMLAGTLLYAWALSSWQHTIPWDTTTKQFQVYNMAGVPVDSGGVSPTVTQFPYNSEQYKIKNTGNVPINITITETWVGTGSAVWTVSGATVGTTFPITLNPDVEAVASLGLSGTSITGSYDWHFNIS